MEQMCEWQEESRDLTRVKYLSAMPGTTVYQSGISDGLIKSEVDHLNWLSIEQALHQDEFLNYTGLSEDKHRECYKRLYDCYCPGPVMDFEHWPETFTFHDPNTDPGHERSAGYAQEWNCEPAWRAEWSSAAPLMIPGSERFTLEDCGTSETLESGGSTAWAAAERLAWMEKANASAEQ